MEESALRSHAPSVWRARIAALVLAVVLAAAGVSLRRDVAALRRAVHFVLAEPGLFLNSSSDATLLRPILEAASEPVEPPTAEAMDRDVAEHGMTPLFVRGESDEVVLAPAG